MGSTNLTVDDLQDMQYKKSRELFILCDKEGKGFVNKFDLQRLQPELSLPPEALEQVFDILDDDKNGYLTLKEFTEGFQKCFFKVGGELAEMLACRAKCLAVFRLSLRSEFKFRRGRLCLSSFWGSIN
uniref:EF-hand domain-containing protein n=1 Tax=Octopus bimaculoides TaxID=37653 RepID=A0A0L8HMF9_OCTBM